MAAFILLVFVFSLAAVSAQEAVSLDGIVKLTPIATGFSRPLYVTHAGDGSNRLFLVEQSGKIWILQDRVRSAQPFLDISHLITPVALTNRYTEQGLLGLVFDPEYASNGIFYINYTNHNGGTVIARYRVSAEDPDSAVASSAQIIFQLAQPYSNHNGGHLAFGPDGYLYITLGDGGSANDPLGAGQNLRLLLGKILRIDVRDSALYTIPPDNPFVGDDAALDEIWAYGLRNVWRFSFDRLTGDMYLADVGQNRWEEVNFQPADSKGGENYGWNVWEGKHIFAGGDAPNHVLPFYQYGRGGMDCSVTGGYVYRGEAIPELDATYLFGDYCSGRIWASRRDDDSTWKTDLFMLTGTQISSFGEDAAGEIYVIDYGGELYRLDPA